MLIELWERFRGYDHWILAEPDIEPSTMEDHEGTYRGQTAHVYDSSDTFVWIDRRGHRRTGSCSVPDDSPLYPLARGEKITIRYNPDKPAEYYFLETLKARLHNSFVGVATVVLVLALNLVPVFVFFHVFRSKL